MTTRPVSITETSPIGSAAALLMELDVRHLPVVNRARELVGILSDRDLRGGDYVAADPVATLMSADPVSVGPDDDISDAIELLLEQRIGALPVVDAEARLVGIISYVDVLRTYQRELAGG